VGPINRSMAGASTAAPIDASGALHWNPASITGLPRSEAEFGLELLQPQARLSSQLTLAPGVTLSSSDESESGAVPIPTFGYVHHDADSELTYGIGLFFIGGFGVNYPASATNPILMPQVGIPAIYANFQVMQIAPTVAVRLTEELSVGVGLTIDAAYLSVDPLITAAPNTDGQYPEGTHTRVHWGGGLQVGVFYQGCDGWNYGFSAKSPQWFEDFRFRATDANGQARTVEFDIDYPMVLSAGVSFTGWADWVFALDVRYIDYNNTEGFRDTGFAPDGSIRGLGWDSIFAIAGGVQYQLTETTKVRAGYSWNENPIRNDQAFFNVASPTILQHTAYLGATIDLTDSTSASIGYAHAFENEVSGPIHSPTFGPLAGSSVRSEVSVDTLMLGLTLRY
jgi:long-chain fatty acid transport protein